MDRKQSIQRQFGASADRYRSSRYHQSAPDLDRMLEAVLLRGHERVLDLGTGTGHTALAFAPRVKEVIGLDLTPAMLDQARVLAAERGQGNVRFELGEAERLPYAEASFDLVTCRVCAHHFAIPGLAVKEAARVLRPGGTVLWVDSVSPDDPAQDTFLNAIELLRDSSHVRNYAVAQWQTMFAEAKLGAEHLQTWAVPLDFENWVQRMQTAPGARAQLRLLFEDATEPIRCAFNLRTKPDSGFDMPIALLRARAT